MLWENNEERGWHEVHAAPANALDWQERMTTLSDLALFNDYRVTVALTGEGDPVTVEIGDMTANGFAVLGVAPLRGRTFSLEETGAEHDPVVVLSHELWVSAFGANESVLGRQIELDGVAHEVVGIMPSTFRYAINQAVLWRPFRWTRALAESAWFRQAHVVRAVARLAPGATVAQARSELDAVAAQLEREYPATNRSMRAGLGPLHEFLVGDQRLPLLLLLGAVGVLLLVACANVTNLWLARTLDRRREMAVRTALGAGRGRIVRQVLTESLVLALVGGLVGLGVGVGIFVLLAAFRPPDLPVVALSFDWRMLGFASAITLASAVLFGTAPAVRSAAFNVASSLVDSSRTGTASRGTIRTGDALVVGEIALALVLVFGAGLMVRTLEKLRAVDMGFDPTNVLTFAISVPRGAYPEWQDRVSLVGRFEEGLSGIPGVVDVGVVRELPLLGGGCTSDFAVAGRGPGEFGTDVGHREASGGYFRALGVPLLSGRLFDADDGPDASLAVVINQAMAERHFANEDPVGLRIAFDREPDADSYWRTIVGVVGNERETLTGEPRPEIIAHYRQDPPGRFRFVLKTSVAPLSLTSTVKRMLGDLDPRIPFDEVATMRSVVHEAMSRERFLMLSLGVFAGAALLLASVGVFGVTSQAVHRRQRDIGIRIALGATRRDVLLHVVGRVVRVVVVGVTLGLAGAAVGARVMDGLIFGVQPMDPATFTVVAVVLATVSVLAGYLPARRANHIDPMSVLRTE